MVSYQVPQKGAHALVLPVLSQQWFRLEPALQLERCTLRKPISLGLSTVFHILAQLGLLPEK